MSHVRITDTVTQIKHSIIWPRECHGVSKPQQVYCVYKGLFKPPTKKDQSSESLVLCERNAPWIHFTAVRNAESVPRLWRHQRFTVTSGRHAYSITIRNDGYWPPETTAETRPREPEVWKITPKRYKFAVIISTWTNLFHAIIDMTIIISNWGKYQSCFCFIHWKHGQCYTYFTHDIQCGFSHTYLISWEFWKWW